MTEIEAKELLEQLPVYRYEQEVQMYQHSDVFNALDLGINALEKQIPMKPTNIQGNPLWGYCPSCNKAIDKSGSPIGCKHCLQRVDWSDEDAE